MVILKKIIILTEYEGSGASGIVKLENFAGRTSCFVRVLGVADKADVCIKCGEDVMYCGTLSEGVMKFGALYDLTAPIYVAVAKEGSIVCMGSNVGRFSASVLSPLLYQYYANKDGGKNVIVDDGAAKTEAAHNTEAISQSEVKAEPAGSDEAEIAAEEYDIDNANRSEEKKSSSRTESRDEQKYRVKSERTIKAETKKEEPFYKQIEASMQELFDKYPSDDELMRLVPDSKWARVPVDEGNYYVVGLIYSDGKPNLICYGIPDKDSSNPPDNSNGCRQWLEIEKGGRGYWMMYQSAVSGQTLTTQII